MKQRTIKIDVCLGSELSKMGYKYTRELAYWYLMKSIFSNSCVYNFSNLSEVSRKLKIKRNTARNHIQFFLDNGWAYLRDGNLCFISYTKMHNKYVTYSRLRRVEVGVTDARDLINKIRYQICKVGYSKFEKLSACVRDLKNTRGLSWMEITRAKRFLNKVGFPLGEIDTFEHEYRVTQRTIAKRIGLSREGAKEVLKKLHYCGLENHGTENILIPAKKMGIKGMPEWLIAEYQFQPFYRLPNKYVFN